MTIGAWQIIIFSLVIALYVGLAYFSIYICKKNRFLKKHINKKNALIGSIAYIAFVSLIFNQTVAYGVGSFILPFFFAFIISLFRNKFKKIFDEDFYRMLSGLLFLSAIALLFQQSLTFFICRITIKQVGVLIIHIQNCQAVC